MSLTLSYICLFVANLDQSTTFYREILDLRPLPHLTTETFRAFELGATVLGLEPNGNKSKKEKDKAHNPIILQFKMTTEDELNNVTQKLKERGVHITQDSVKHSFGTVTSFLDPDGNRLELLYQ